jgi:hypothetical protein
MSRRAFFNALLAVGVSKGLNLPVGILGVEEEEKTMLWELPPGEYYGEVIETSNVLSSDWGKTIEFTYKVITQEGVEDVTGTLNSR